MKEIGYGTTKNLVLAASIAAMFGVAPVLAEETLEGEFNDGFSFSSSDSNFVIKPEGRAQMDYRSFDHDGTANTFDMRRVYFGVKGKLFKDWSFEITSNLDNGELEYGYLDYKFSDAAKLRMGALKFNYSFEEMTSSRFLDFAERSMVNSWVPKKDVGVEIYGEPVKKTFFYALGIANGEGQNSTENSATVDDQDVIVRSAVNLADMIGFESGVLHLGLNYSSGTTVNNDPGSQRTEGRGLTFFNADASGLAELDRERTGLEAVVIYGPVKIQAEVNTANYSGAGGYDRDIETRYISANWLITGESYKPNYTFGGMKAIKPANPVEKGGMGAWEVGVRLTQFDASDFKAAGDFAGTAEADAMTIGLQWIPNNMTRFMLTYVKTDFDTPITAGTEQVNSETAVILRTAVYF